MDRDVQRRCGKQEVGKANPGRAEARRYKTARPQTLQGERLRQPTFHGILNKKGDQPMRKKIINQGPEGVSAADKNWLDLEVLAQVEVSSEDAAHPIESALISNTGSGWQAAQPGKQTIRLLFDKPQNIRSICLVFQEDEQARTQEFVLSWSSDGGQSYMEITRQQYNFSPSSTTREVEDYTVELNGLTTLELIIVPDISGGPACASVAQLRLA
jgi:hypothetical protein